MAHVLNFGAATVTHNAVDLGKTTGGGSLSIVTAEQEQIKADFDVDEIILGGTGTVNFYEWSAAVSVSTTLLLHDFGVVIFTTSEIKITLYKCKILLAKELEFGVLKHKPFKVRLVFTPDSNGDVIKIEEA